MDVVVGDIVEVRWTEIELRGVNLLALGTLDGQVQISGQMSVGVVGRDLGTVLFAKSVIKGRQNDGRPELAFVNQVARLLIVRVESHGERRRDLLLDAKVIVIRALRQRRRIKRRERRRGGIGELRDSFASDEFE